VVKYSKDGPVNDPVMRCDSCVKIIRTETLKNIGKCPHCGNRKVRSLQTFSSLERDKMVKWNIDPAFLAIFESTGENPDE